MNIGLAVEIDSELERLSGAIGRIDGNLKRFFLERDYGDDVSNVFIGLILTGPGSEKLHSVRPVKYRKLFRSKSRITGQLIELKNVLEFDVKPDYGRARVLNAEAAERYISQDLVDGVDQLRRVQDRFPAFDITRFKRDLAVCLSVPPVGPGGRGDTHT